MYFHLVPKGPQHHSKMGMDTKQLDCRSLPGIHMKPSRLGWTSMGVQRVRLRVGFFAQMLALTLGPQLSVVLGKLPLYLTFLVTLMGKLIGQVGEVLRDEMNKT